MSDLLDLSHRSRRWQHQQRPINAIRYGRGQRPRTDSLRLWGVRQVGTGQTEPLRRMPVATGPGAIAPGGQHQRAVSPHRRRGGGGLTGCPRGPWTGSRPRARAQPGPGDANARRDSSCVRAGVRSGCAGSSTSAPRRHPGVRRSSHHHPDDNHGLREYRSPRPPCRARTSPHPR